MDSRTPTSQVGEASCKVRADPTMTTRISSHWGCFLEPAGPCSGKNPGAFRGQRSLADVFTGLERTAFLCLLHPQYFHPSPCGHRAQEARLRSLRTANRRGVCASWRGALRSAPPASGVSAPAQRHGPSVRLGPHPCRWRPPLNPHTPTDGAPLNGPHGGHSRRHSCCTRSWLSSFGVLAQTLPFPRDFLWPPS